MAWGPLSGCCSWFLELWAIASTPAKAGRLRKSTVERLLKQHRIRRIDAETVLRILREPAIKVAESVAEAASIHIRSLVARLRTVNRELREAERKLDELCTAISEIEQTSGESLQRRDVAILRSMPGIGRINLGTLLSEASGPLSRRDCEGLRTLSGAAPVTKRSGKSLIVVRRYAAHVRLRDTVYHWARVATQRDPKCRVRYTALRKRGHSHGRALRSVADRLLALACELLPPTDIQGMLAAFAQRDLLLWGWSPKQGNEPTLQQRPEPFGPRLRGLSRHASS